MDSRRKTHPADYITILNAVAGFLAITYIIDGRFRTVDARFLQAALLIMAALCLDGVDGYLARRFGGWRGGQYLDSFADTISFCIAPALMIYRICYDPDRGSAWVAPENTLAVAASTLVAAFGILRLARFIESDHEKGGFKGLPASANAVLLTSSAYLFGASYATPVLLLTIVTSFLMISEIPYPKIADAARGPIVLIIALVCGVALAFMIFAGNASDTARFLFLVALASSLGYLIGGPMYAGKPRPGSEVLRVQRE
jgi:CDP-diacylglycerol--serine O-phosphatidyltransferase